MSYEVGDKQISGLIKNFGKIGTSGSPQKFQGQFKVYSYGFLYKNIQLMDLFLTYLNSKRHQILLSFTIECLEKFKPLVDILYNQLT